MTTITSVETAHYRLPLDPPLSAVSQPDAPHGAVAAADAADDVEEMTALSDDSDD